MSVRAIHLVFGLATLSCAGPVMAAPHAAAVAPAPWSRMAPLRLAQNTDGAGSTPGGVAPGGAVPDASTTTTPPAAALPSLARPSTAPGATTAATPAAAAPAPQAPALTGTARNPAAALPSLAQPAMAPQGGSAASIPFGGPQTAIGPAYGSTLRDPGASNGGTPLYSTAPTTLGGPINGTANAYTAALPNGSLPNGYVSNSAGNTARGRDSDDNPSGFNQAPLGSRPNTRDKFGTFGARAGYDAQGVYTGTAPQAGTGYGYGSAYVPSARPTGGLLGTNVDATGPLRPYVPQSTGTTGRPNSGYGVPNGSRATHMDARGIQRVD